MFRLGCTGSRAPRHLHLHVVPVTEMGAWASLAGELISMCIRRTRTWMACWEQSLLVLLIPCALTQPCSSLRRWKQPMSAGAGPGNPTRGSNSLCVSHPSLRCLMQRMTWTLCCGPTLCVKVCAADCSPCYLQGVVDGLLAATVEALGFESPAGSNTSAGGEPQPCMSSVVGQWLS